MLVEFLSWLDGPFVAADHPPFDYSIFHTQQYQDQRTHWIKISIKEVLCGNVIEYSIAWLRLAAWRHLLELGFKDEIKVLVSYDYAIVHCHFLQLESRVRYHAPSWVSKGHPKSLNILVECCLLELIAL